jgi:hypothetical protein
MSTLYYWYSHGRIRISRAKGERALFGCNKKAPEGAVVNLKIY